jgi:glycosyltransferase involved in cell wall biosynthesis
MGIWTPSCKPWMRTQMTERPTPKRLLFLINDAWFFVTHILPLARAAVAAGYDTHAALPFQAAALDTADALEAIRATGAQLHDLPLQRAGYGPAGELRALWDIFTLCRRLRPGILHCISIKPVIYGGLVARCLGLARAVFFITGLGHVFIAEGGKARLMRFLVKRAYRMTLSYARGVTVFENEVDRSLFVEAKLLPREQSVLIPGVGVDAEKFHPALVAPPGPPLVMLPARLQNEKGVREFVEAARILRSRSIGVRMVLVGYADFARPGGIREAELRAWVAEGVVEWWGHSSTMPATLREAHIVCLPSYREGFSKTLLEAAATGLPIVTSDAPGCRDAVLAGESALLVPPRDATALAEALERLIADPELRARMGARGREHVVREFTLARFITANLALYAA